MKIGVDFHGVLDNPKTMKFFEWLMKKVLTDMGGEVHLITGSHSYTFLNETKNRKLYFTHFFSISDYLERKYPSKLRHTDKAKNHPVIDEILWDRCKGWYAKKNKLDMMFDDNTNYIKYFSTPISLVINKRNIGCLLQRTKRSK